MPILNQLKIDHNTYDLAAKYDFSGNDIENTYINKDQISQIEQAVKEAEKIDVKLEENVLIVTDRKGEQKSINLDALALEEVLNGVKKDVTKLKEGAVYGGIASTITNPGTPTVKVFYLPIEVGTYTNFGNIEITESDVAFLYWDGTAWVKHSLNLSSVIDSIKKAASDAGIEAKNALDAAAKAADKANQAKSAADTNKNSIEGLTQTVGDIETKVNGLNVPKIVCLTQAEYEALEVKDPDTFYYTNEE